jgi:hypothetical protein
VDEQGLGEPRNADDQAVTADEQREQHLVDDFVLADDELLQLFDDSLTAVLHPIGQRDVVLLHVLFDLRHWVPSWRLPFYRLPFTRDDARDDSSIPPASP